MTRIVLSMLLVFSLSFLASCGDDNKAAPCAAPAFDVTGAWNVTATTGSNTCNDPVGISETFPANLTQSGSTVTVAEIGKSGQLCGNVLTLSYSDTMDGETLSETMTLTFSSAASFSGSGAWTWAEPGLSCKGTDYYSGTK